MSQGIRIENSNDRKTKLEGLYNSIRKARNNEQSNVDLLPIFNEVEEGYSNEWLLNLELNELLLQYGDEEKSEIVLRRLMNIKEANPNLRTLIDSGLDMIKQSIFL